MALTGLRPLKETNTLGNSPQRYALLSGAYDIFVQDQYTAADAAQTYYAAKWLKLAAGEYQLRFICDDKGTFLLNGTQVATGTYGGDWLTPVVVAFNVPTSDTYRWDIQIYNGPASSPSFMSYELSKDGVVVEVSRAQDFIGDLKPIPDSALGPKPPYNEDIRLSYPVFLPKPNWKNSVIERLEWLTDVLTSESGAEQRRKLRQYPRRSIEASFIASDNYAGLIDSYLSGVGYTNGLVPLWWDETPISGAVVAGGVDVFGDFRYREFNASDVVIIRRPGAITDYELNIIAERSDTKLVMLYGLQQDTRGATITPVRVAQIREQLSGVIMTDRVKQFQLRFFTVEAADYPAEWTFPIYERTNLPILTWEPNYRESFDINYDRQVYTWDNEVGNPYTVDPGGTLQQGEKMGFTVFGRAEMHGLKRTLYKMSGRWRELHVPSGSDEFVLARDISDSAGALVVYRSGYNQYRLSQQATRRDILIELYDGRHLPNTIISSRVVGDEEWLFLQETVPPVSKDQVRRISYMPRSRLDIDAVEINRLTDADGAAQVALTFKAITERRNAPPIPIQ